MSQACVKFSHIYNCASFPIHSLTCGNGCVGLPTCWFELDAQHERYLELWCVCFHADHSPIFLKRLSRCHWQVSGFQCIINFLACRWTLRATSGSERLQYPIIPWLDYLTQWTCGASHHPYSGPYLNIIRLMERTSPYIPLFPALQEKSPSRFWICRFLWYLLITTLFNALFSGFAGISGPYEDVRLS